MNNVNFKMDFLWNASLSRRQIFSSSQQYSPVLKHKVKEVLNTEPRLTTREDLLSRKKLNEASRLVENFFRTVLLYMENSSIPAGFLLEIDYIREVAKSIDPAKNIDSVLSQLYESYHKVPRRLKASIERLAMVPEGEKHYPLPYLPKSEQVFMKVSSKLTAKQLISFKNIKEFAKPAQELIFAFLLMVDQVDSTLDFIGHHKQLNLHILDCCRTYFANPGHIVQRIRDFPTYIRTKKISSKAIRMARKIVKKIENAPRDLMFVKIFMEELFKLFDLYKPLYGTQKENNTVVKHKRALSSENRDSLNFYMHRTTASDISGDFMHYRHCKATLLRKFYLKAGESNPSAHPFSLDISCTRKKLKLRTKSRDFTFNVPKNPHTRSKSQSKFPIEHLIRERNRILKENQLFNNKQSQENSLAELHHNFTMTTIYK